MKSLSCVQLFVTPWIVAQQAPLSMGFSRPEYWSGLPFPSAGDLPNPGIEPRSPASHARAHTHTHTHTGEHTHTHTHTHWGSHTHTHTHTHWGSPVIWTCFFCFSLLDKETVCCPWWQLFMGSPQPMALLGEFHFLSPSTFL